MDATVGLAQAERENEKLRTDIADLGRRLEQLGIDCDDPERQLDWFRRQLFGSKSEKRVEIPPERTAFRERPGLEDPKRPEEPEFELAERGKRGKKSFEGAADESGPGFGPDVPGGTVAIDNPEAAGIRTGRSIPANWMLGSASLSAPICDAQFRSIPEARRSRWTRRRSGPGGSAPGRCGRPGSGRSSATATKSPSPSGCPGKTARFPTCSATPRAHRFPTAARPAPPARNPETERFGTPAAGRTPGASSKRRRIPSRGLPPRPWSRSEACFSAKGRFGKRSSRAGRRARRISVHPSSRVEEPVPRLWKDLFAANPMNSDLGTGVPCRASDLPGAS